jgi:hypothetical protein
LFIDASGNVGAGTSSPTFSAGGGVQAKYATFSAFRATVGANTGTDFAASSDGTGYVYVRDNAGLIFGTSNTERMRLDSSGRLGLGTSTVNAGAALHIARNTNGNTATLRMSGNDGVGDGGAGIVFADNETVKWSLFTRRYSSNNRLYISTAENDTASAKVTITEGGAVGIGTTPALPFHLYNSSAALAYFESTSADGPYVIWRSSGTSIGDIGSAKGVSGSGSATDFMIASRSTYPLILGTGSSEKARLTSDGKLLVGTSSSLGASSGQATQKLQIAGGTDGGLVIGTFSADQYAANLDFFKSRSGTVGTKTIVQNGDTIGKIYFSGADGTSYIPAAHIEAYVDGTPGTNDMPGRLVFSTTADGASSPTERMRITNGGTITCPPQVSGSDLVGTEACGFVADGTFAPVYKVKTALTSTKYAALFANGNGLVGNIMMNGSSTAYNTSSDYRLKENVVPLTGASARINQLKPSQFNFKADPTTIVDGFIAHEAQAVVPECVTGTKDEVDDEGNPVYQGIDQSKLVPLLTAALQEALAEIESLKARVTALEP